ncbi:hypothetical protein M422DRAFT_267651 [Sphaerobolus stellatus SS14]|uniref:Ubiquitin-like protease family profile domain-containing protein n=1 Tax=Sphaerobolus stellatus (strain SS14) TaxID=990650 RepID=A0A0C9UZL6_SPHS4|nr:hypothetical protein M422DRAFT_267651 [Sphaerobolus stellatus SS14]
MTHYEYDTSDSDIVVLSSTSNQTTKAPEKKPDANNDVLILISSDTEMPKNKPSKKTKNDTNKKLKAHSTGDAHLVCVLIPNSLPLATKTFTQGTQEAACLRLRQQELDRLEPRQWFNDIVMDYGLSQALRRHQLSESPLCKLWVFSTFFYTKLRTKGYPSVASWSRRWDVFAQELIVIPVHMAYHWSIIVVSQPNASLLPTGNVTADLAGAQILSMDSLGGKQEKARDTVADWLFQVAEPHLQRNKWITPISRQIQVPQQSNLYDCGPYSIHNLSRFLMHSACVCEAEILKGSPEWDRIWNPHLASHMRTSLRQQVRLRARVPEAPVLIT